MSALRTLALSYLAAASVFAVGATLVARPDLARGLQALGQMARDDVLAPAWERARQQDAQLLDALDHPPVVRLAIAPLKPGEERLLPRHGRATPLGPRDLAANDDRMTQSEYSASASLTILPDLSPEAAPVPPEPKLLQPRSAAPRSVGASRSDQIRKSPRSPRIAPPQFDIARDAAPPSSRAMAVRQRLGANLTPEMLDNFDLFIFVSKAETGPAAQRMFVFRKDHGALTLLYDWAASTGREKDEISPRGRSSFTATPAGFYQLDPDRMYRRYHSYSWDQDMPWAMFFNWERQGMKTGLAIHSATGDDIARLGSRASAGCVHLAPENAETLYRLIRTGYRGRAPRFAYTADTQTMSNRGGFAHSRDGSLKMADGYRVLIDIDDYAGRDVVASN
jgi:lipoprotein-anchoring transpeptidase ErfK/SrfK